MNAKDLGDMAELAAANRLAALGYTISFPFGDNERYDLIYDDGDQLHRAQVRKSSEREGFLVFKCYSNHRSQGDIKREHFDEEEIDCFLIWHEREDKIYKVPIEDAPKTEMRLRLEPTQNNQSNGVNIASDYEL